MPSLVLGTQSRRCSNCHWRTRWELVERGGGGGGGEGSKREVEREGEAVSCGYI